MLTTATKLTINNFIQMCTAATLTHAAEMVLPLIMAAAQWTQCIISILCADTMYNKYSKTK